MKHDDSSLLLEGERAKTKSAKNTVTDFRGNLLENLWISLEK